MNGIGPKGAAVVASLLMSVALAACGGSNNDNGTIFILPSASPSAAASAAGSASPSTEPSATPATPVNSPTALASGRIIIDRPDGSNPISSPVEVSGTASVTNGTVVAVVLDASGNELGRATTTASASAPDWGHYDVTVNFTGASSGAGGKIKVFGVRSDGTTPTWYYFILIRFA